MILPIGVVTLVSIIGLFSRDGKRTVWHSLVASSDSAGLSLLPKQPRYFFAPSSPAVSIIAEKCKTKSGQNVTFPVDSHGGALFGSKVYCDNIGRYSIVDPRYILDGKYYAFADYKLPKNEDFTLQVAAGNDKDAANIACCLRYIDRPRHDILWTMP